MNLQEIETGHPGIDEFQNIYSPGTILGVYANAIRSAADGKVILAKGIYLSAPMQKDYSGYYYDSFRGVTDNKSIKLKVHGALRVDLENNQVYIIKGYIEKRINFSNIELVLVVDDVFMKEENQVSEEDLKRFEIIKARVAKGFRDVESLVKERIYGGNKIKIANIYGSTAIVHKDFEKGLGEAVEKFEISEFRCNFSSAFEIRSMIDKLCAADFDAIALVRGGGEKASLEVFNGTELANTALLMQPLLITALGHTVDETLMDKLADKKFALPHDYGNSLKVWVDQAVEEQSRSKSVFIEQVKKDLDKTYSEQIKTLQTQLLTRNKEFEDIQLKNKEFLDQVQKEKAEGLLFKEKAFEAQLKAVAEQLQSKDESLKAITQNLEITSKQQIAAATAELNLRYETLKATKGSSANVWIYVLLAAAAGLALGWLLR